MSRHKDIRIEVLEATLKAVVDELEEVHHELEETKKRHKRITRRMANKIVNLKRGKCL